MKNIFYLFIVICSNLTCLGQNNDFLETFEGDFDFQLITVTRDCFSCKPIVKNEKVVQYHFDKVKSILTDSTFYKGSLSGIGIRKYENGDLTSYKCKGTWVSTSNVGDFGMTWDSSITTYKIDYQYEKGQLINKKNFDAQTERLTTEVIYTYDKNGKLIKELIKDYPDPDYFLTFKPNSTESFYDKDEVKFTLRRKEYSYKDSQTIIKYFKSDSLTGVQSIFKSKSELNIKTTRSEGNTVYKAIKRFNSSNQIIEIVQNDTGYDAFGFGYDFLKYDRETFEYDDKNRLSIHKYFNDSVLVMTDFYRFND